MGTSLKKFFSQCSVARMLVLSCFQRQTHGLAERACHGSSPASHLHCIRKHSLNSKAYVYNFLGSFHAHACLCGLAYVAMVKLREDPVRHVTSRICPCEPGVPILTLDYPDTYKQSCQLMVCVPNKSTKLRENTLVSSYSRSRWMPPCLSSPLPRPSSHDWTVPFSEPGHVSINVHCNPI